MKRIMFAAALAASTPALADEVFIQDRGNGVGCKKMATKVRITWNGMGGELNAVTVEDDGENSLAEAIIKLIQDNIVLPGDSFTVQEIE